MNVLSLFSGIGGLELGLERAGMTVVGQVEIDPFCRRVLAKHWPEVPRHDDVRTAVEWWLGGARPPVDVVCGGFPCQPVSVAGKGLAQADDRWLWPAAWAVIRDLRPRFAILENVPGLLSRGFGDVLGDLAAIGYDAEWDCVPAAAVGAPHLRGRVFIVAHPDRIGWTAGRDDAGQAENAEPVHRGTPPVADSNRERQPQPRYLPIIGRRRPADSGWWSAEPRFRRMADGISEGLDRGGLNADAEEGRSGEGLRPLREPTDAAPSPERPPGGPRGLPSAQILRPAVHGASATERRPVNDVSQAVLEGCMRVVWEHRADRRAPHGRGPDEQLAGELAHTVSRLPHDVALGERQAALAEAQSYVHRLQQACEAIGALRDPSQSVPETWFALSGEAQGWVWLAARGGPWVAEWPGTPRVAHGVPQRVDRLRALGNAVVPQVAEHVGRLVMSHA